MSWLPFPLKPFLPAVLPLSTSSPLHGKMGLTQGAGAHPAAGTYLPHFQWLRAPSVKNYLARVKLQEITPYVLSCSCAKRDGGSFHFQKSSETRSLEIFLDSCEGNLGADSLLDCPPPVPSTDSPSVHSWVDRTPRGPRDSCGRAWPSPAQG